MSYTLERLDSPIYVIVFNKDFNMGNEMGPLNQLMVGKFDNDPASAFVIIADIRNLSLALSDMMLGTKATIDSDINPNQHPKVKETIIISENKMLQLSLDGLHILGMVKDAIIVKSMDEALELAGELMSA